MFNDAADALEQLCFLGLKNRIVPFMGRLTKGKIKYDKQPPATSH
jgi:hypothetical protein